MPMLQLDRRRRETSLLAIIGLVAVVSLRSPLESRPILMIELIAIGLGFIGFAFGLSKGNRRLSAACCLLLVSPPIVNAFVSRKLDAAIPMELTALMFFGVVALALAVLPGRLRSMSLVASGFLTLFCTVISDAQYAILIAIAWMAVCVWHLVANHWERIDLCAADQVSRNGSLRPLTVIAAVALFVLGGLVAKDRFGEPDRFQFGFMPTSGGSEWSDPAATHGVGSGDAAIAAKDHAESFGAVESDLFLESTESTLFDMFSDSIGEPKKKGKSERRQGMSSENVLESHSRTARSDKGSASFSTDRQPPKKQHRHLEDVAKNALVQWSGPTGIRLAMNRYDTFDGVDWTNEASYRQETLTRKEFGDQVWFFDQNTIAKVLESDPDRIAQGKLKMIRLETTRLPSPMMSSGVHIKLVDRQDFFGIDDDGSFFMPGRERVPPLTVVHTIGLRAMEDELIASVNSKKSTRSGDVKNAALPVETDRAISELVQQWTDQDATPYAKLRSIVQNLRTEFVFDRNVDFTSDSPITEFLDKRRGGDHLFATTAALMAREIGLQSRLVTGLYVRPSAVEIAAGHTNVLPRDVHTWVEIRMNYASWFEIEPTPSYNEPNYDVSWWLASQRFAAQHWSTALMLIAGASLIFLTRLIWLELGLTVLWWASVALSPRRRLAFALRIVETRATLLGHSRPTGSPPREWLLHEVTDQETPDSQLKVIIRSFCDLADRLYFGNVDTDPSRAQIQVANGLVGALPMRTLKKLLMENRS